MAIQQNPYPLRIEKTILAKAKIMAKENGRSLNKEIEFILKSTISDYEATHGIIQLPDPNETSF